MRRPADGNDYLLKIVNMKLLSEKDRNNALKEVQILASIRHCNVICFKETFIDQATSSIWLVMLLKPLCL